MGIEETARKIKSMEIRGAALIARKAAEALGLFAEEYQGDNFREDVKKAGEMLLSTRPTAVSLWNAVHYITQALHEMNEDEARKAVKKRANEFIERSLNALETIGRLGSRRLKSGDIVLTHCNSSAALAVIKHAIHEGKDIKVYATESRPWRQGFITAKELTKEGIDTTLIVDAAVRFVMPSIDAVVVGADTVASNGAVINKIGTSQIALCAHEARIPFMVCCETYKFSPWTLHGELVEIEERAAEEVARSDEIGGAKVFNPVFDATPPEYIDVLVTEIGVLSPYAAYEVIAHYFGQKALFEGVQ